MVAAPAKIDPAAGVGYIMPSFREGSLFLKNEQGRMVRVAWEPVGDESASLAKGAKRWRAVPAGGYTLVGYRVARTDANGDKWFVSAIAPKGIRKVQVRARDAQKVSIDPSIWIESRINTKDGVMIQAPIHGQHHAGISIYRKGKRIPMGYVVTGEDGKQLESGKMNYG